MFQALEVITLTGRELQSPKPRGNFALNPLQALASGAPELSHQLPGEQRKRVKNLTASVVDLTRFRLRGMKFDEQEIARRFGLVLARGFLSMRSIGIL